MSPVMPTEAWLEVLKVVAFGAVGWVVARTAASPRSRQTPQSPQTPAGGEQHVPLMPLMPLGYGARVSGWEWVAVAIVGVPWMLALRQIGAYSPDAARVLGSVGVASVLIVLLSQRWIFSAKTASIQASKRPH